ncbi:MAG TPA: hypothetical protein VLI39_13355 [Sedimentisphaerales bacterium]|nr:hypothetical protein [Sedimentisphaerales bacterium]
MGDDVDLLEILDDEARAAVAVVALDGLDHVPHHGQPLEDEVPREVGIHAVLEDHDRLRQAGLRQRPDLLHAGQAGHLRLDGKRYEPLDLLRAQSVRFRQDHHLDIRDRGSTYSSWESSWEDRFSMEWEGSSPADNAGTRTSHNVRAPTVRPPEVRVLGRFRTGRVIIATMGTILAVAVPCKLDRHVPVAANADPRYIRHIHRRQRQHHQYHGTAMRSA